MYTSPEAVYLELKLESKHVLALFHHIQKEQALSLKWFSTHTIFELINRVFSLQSQSIALVYKQFVDVHGSGKGIDANLYSRARVGPFEKTLACFQVLFKRGKGSRRSG